MLAKQLCNVLVVGLGTIAAVHFAAAREGGNGRGQGGGGQDTAKEHGKGHMHHQKNGHDLLGAKLKQDGKHAVGKFKDKTVTAEVKGGKVKNMTAGDLQPKRVRTKMKMASVDGLIVPIALQLAQIVELARHGFHQLVNLLIGVEGMAHASAGLARQVEQEIEHERRALLIRLHGQAVAFPAVQRFVGEHARDHVQR